jgi:hypothetical protein
MSEHIIFEKFRDKESKLISSLKNNEVRIEKDPDGEKAYLLNFNFGEVVVTVRVHFADYAGADMWITNIRTMPKVKAGEGYGSGAIQKLLGFAKENDIKHICVAEVLKQSESFWQKNGFVKMNNASNNYMYKGEAIS